MLWIYRKGTGTPKSNFDERTYSLFWSNETIMDDVGNPNTSVPDSKWLPGDVWVYHEINYIHSTNISLKIYNVGYTYFMAP